MTGDLAIFHRDLCNISGDLDTASTPNFAEWGQVILFKTIFHKLFEIGVISERQSIEMFSTAIEAASDHPEAQFFLKTADESWSWTEFFDKYVERHMRDNAPNGDP